MEFLWIAEGGNRARYLCSWSFYKHYRGAPHKRIPEGLFGRTLGTSGTHLTQHTHTNTVRAQSNRLGTRGTHITLPPHYINTYTHIESINTKRYIWYPRDPFNTTYTHIDCKGTER